MAAKRTKRFNFMYNTMLSLRHVYIHLNPSRYCIKAKNIYDICVTPKGFVCRYNRTFYKCIHHIQSVPVIFYPVCVCSIIQSQARGYNLSWRSLLNIKKMYKEKTPDSVIYLDMSFRLISGTPNIRIYLN